MDWVGGLGQKRVGEYFMHLQFQYGNLFVRCGVGVQMHSFARGYPVIQHCLLKIILCHLNCLGPFVENQLNINVRVYWTLDSIPLIYMSILMSVPHRYDYCSFIVSCEIGKCESINFVILFQDCYSYSGFLVFLYEFQNQLVNFCKDVSWNLVRIALKLQTNLGSLAISSILNLPIREHRMSFHLF